MVTSRTSPFPAPSAFRLPPSAFCFLLCALVVAGTAAAADRTRVDAAFKAFWDAADPEAASRRIDDIVQTGVSFEDALARLRAGRRYSTNVERGTRQLIHQVRTGSSDPAGLDHPYAIVIPQDYDPARPYPVRVQLHGGVSRPLRPTGQADAIARIPGSSDQIYVLPSAWGESVWWFASQADNIAGILDRLKRSYNVDENRVHLTGISDGGTGAYFMAFRNPTPFASFLPLNGNMLVLASPRMLPDGEMFPGNAVNKPFFVVNGGKDPLYPAEGVRPVVEHLRTLGAYLVFHVQKDAGHNTEWWPNERAAFEQFVDQHPRNPLPDRLSWQTETTERYHRFDWLIIDRLGHVRGEASLPDSNRIEMQGETYFIFPQSDLTGRVDLVRRGNTVEVSTTGVQTFTLLLSPSLFDFSKPITVNVNGRRVFQKRVQRSIATLLKWAARDNDRTALFGAEVQIEVGK